VRAGEEFSAQSVPATISDKIAVAKKSFLYVLTPVEFVVDANAYAYLHVGNTVRFNRPHDLNKNSA
jgi:hypothetical protein